MEQYILKSALVAEIERLRKKNNESENVYDFGTEHALKSILSFLDTLKVKEVDLETEIDNISEKYRGLESLCEHDVIEICEHFFKFGAQWKEQQMIKNSVEGIVREDSNGYLYVYAAVYRYNGFSRLDKVKAIIIKED